MVEYFREGARPRVPLSAKRGRTANVRLVANFSRNAKKADEVIRRAIYQRLLPLFFERGRSTQTSRARNQNVR